MNKRLLDNKNNYIIQYKHIYDNKRRKSKN